MNVQIPKHEGAKSTFSMATSSVLDLVANTKAIHNVIYVIQVYLMEPIQVHVQDMDVTNY